MAQHVHVHSEAPDFFAACYQRIRAAVHEQCRCRECGEHCTFTANLCETCGTQDPVPLAHLLGACCWSASVPWSWRSAVWIL